MEISRVPKLLLWVAGLLGHLLCSGQPHQVVAPASRAQQARNAARVLAVSKARLHIREATGRNDGPEVELAQKLAGARKGDPWCGCEMFMQQRLSGLPWPKWPAAARNWSQGTDKRTYYISGIRGSLDSIRLAHIVTFYYANLGRVGHVGRVVAFSRPIRAGRPVRGYTVRSGNTGRGGGRDGAGNYDVFYPAYSIYAASNWLY